MVGKKTVLLFLGDDWSQERILAAAFSGYVGRQEAAAAAHVAGNTA